VRAEHKALVARLKSSPVLANKTETVVKLNTDGSAVRTNYVVAIPAVPIELDDKRYMAPQRFESARFLSYDVKVVAVDADGLLMLVEAVQKQMIGHQLVSIEDGLLPGPDLLPGEDVVTSGTLTGRVCDPIKLATDNVEEGSVQYDKTARLYFVTLTFEFWSREV
jgi:hypothetical protein